MWWLLRIEFSIDGRMHAQAYGIDDNRFDLRPIFINPAFEFQFK